jgi:hypothetical protein
VNGHRCAEGQNESRPWRDSREDCAEAAEPKYGLCARHLSEWQTHTGHTDADALRALKALGAGLEADLAVSAAADTDVDCDY